MEDRNYYYLVAGLPDLVPEQSKVPFSLAEFMETLREHLHPDDFRQAERLWYPRKHSQLLALLDNGTASGSAEDEFSREQMIESLQRPAYLRRFYQARREGTPIWPRMSWENQLTRLYYEEALLHARGFLRRWLVFDLNLRNFLAAWNIREFNLNAEGQLIGENEWTAALTRSHARDFGLSRELPFVDRLLHALEQEDLLDREKAIDRIRWNYIDECNTFCYFNIDVVLGYLLKLMMLERWRGLEPAGGRRAVGQLIGALERSAELPEKLV